MDEQVCHVWLADLEERRPSHDALLDDVERGRAHTFVRPDDRSRFVLGAALLKLAIASSTAVAPAAVLVERTCDACGGPHGRPRVSGCGLHLSVSHSASLVAVSLTWAGPVGIDIETRASGRAHPPAASFVSESEPVQRPEDLLTYWCRKESAVKATGDGLRLGLREVVVSPAGEAARLVSYDGAPIAAFMTDLDLGADYAAALTVLGAGPAEVMVHRGLASIT